MQHLLVLFCLGYSTKTSLSRLNSRRSLVERSFILCRVYLKKSLSFTYGSTFVYTKLHDEARYLRTDFNILLTLNSSWILLCLRAGCYTYRFYSELVITHFSTALATATSSQYRQAQSHQGNSVRSKSSVFVVHIHIQIINVFFFSLKTAGTYRSY